MRRLHFVEVHDRKKKHEIFSPLFHVPERGSWDVPILGRGVGEIGRVSLLLRENLSWLSKMSTLWKDVQSDQFPCHNESCHGAPL